MQIVHTQTFTHGRPVVTPRQKRQTMATESLHFHVASQFMEPYGLFVVDKTALKTLTTAICLCGNRICNCCLVPPPPPFAVRGVPSSICVRGLEACGKEFVKSSISCQLKITHILPRTAPAENPVMLLPSCSSMLLILFSEGNRIFGGLSVKGAEKDKRHN